MRRHNQSKSERARASHTQLQTDHNRLHSLGSQADHRQVAAVLARSTRARLALNPYALRNSLPSAWFARANSRRCSKSSRTIRFPSSSSLSMTKCSLPLSRLIKGTKRRKLLLWRTLSSWRICATKLKSRLSSLPQRRLHCWAKCIGGVRQSWGWTQTSLPL